MLAKVNTIEGVSVLKVGKMTNDNSIFCFFHVLRNRSGVELGFLLKTKLVIRAKLKIN